MLNMFTFNLFSVCHSLGQSVTGIALFIFWLRPEVYNYNKKFSVNYVHHTSCIKYLVMRMVLILDGNSVLGAQVFGLLFDPFKAFH